MRDRGGDGGVRAALDEVCGERGGGGGGGSCVGMEMYRESRRGARQTGRLRCTEWDVKAKGLCMRKVAKHKRT